jgi:hypothetical protein
VVLVDEVNVLLGGVLGVTDVGVVFTLLLAVVSVVLGEWS